MKKLTAAEVRGKIARLREIAKLIRPYVVRAVPKILKFLRGPPGAT